MSDERIIQSVCPVCTEHGGVNLYIENALLASGGDL